MIQQHTILLVDNDAIFLSLTKEYLEQKGYLVLVAGDVDRARQLLATHEIDLTVLDVRLSNDNDDRDKTGINLAKELAVWQDTPNIILTRVESFEYAVESLKTIWNGKSPAIDYVTKKDGLEVLLAAVRDALVSSPASCSAPPARQNGIPSHLKQELHTILSNCGCCTSNQTVRNVFMDERLSQWQDELPETDSIKDRIQTTIYYLYRQKSETGENGLVLFLRVLSDELPPGNAYQKRLSLLADKLAREV